MCCLRLVFRVSSLVFHVVVCEYDTMLGSCYGVFVVFVILCVVLAVVLCSRNLETPRNHRGTPEEPPTNPP